MERLRTAQTVLHLVSHTHTRGGTLLSCVLTAVGTPESSAGHPEESSETDPRGGWQLAAEARGLEEWETVTG